MNDTGSCITDSVLLGCKVSKLSLNLYWPTFTEMYDAAKMWPNDRFNEKFETYLYKTTMLCSYVALNYKVSSQMHDIS